MTILITGASSGIGLELARVCAKEGHSLVLVSRSDIRIKELPSNTIYIKEDLSLPGSACTVYKTVRKKKIGIDALVNNAGFGDYGPFVDSDIEKVRSMMELNMCTLTELTHFFARDMKKRGSGKIMNLCSTASFFPGASMAVYFASKHYVLAFSEALAEELQPFGISVTALCPGPTKSNFQKVSGMGKSKLVKNAKLPTSGEVAEYGYRAMLSGKRIAIHGKRNRLLAQMPRFLPRMLVVKLVARAQST